MDSEVSIKTFQAAVTEAAVRKLGRELTANENEFIVSRGGFVALEMILDAINAGTKEGIERYLNSDKIHGQPFITS
ncbi:MAG TPA: hypothetical protein VF719_08480 [Abditibacteriaceae bacterium]|jgi:hypothetical protein